jgi:alpha-N-arabinofuranosidase
MMRTRIRRIAVSLIFLAWILFAGLTAADDVSLSVDVNHPSHAINPRLYGIFFEDINFAADGGLCAELVKNGSFEFSDGLTGWSEVNEPQGDGNVRIADKDPALAGSPHYLRITSAGGRYGVVNEGFRGMGVRAGERYRFTVWARCPSGKPVRLHLALVAVDGTELAATDLGDIRAMWSTQSAVLQPDHTEAKARLTITLVGPGAVNLDMVSLSPDKTWQNRPHGLRADLVQMLADLKPSFLRFPGGCIVEGSDLSKRYQWKTTIGPLADRRLIINRWNTVFPHRLTPDYFQSFGLGFYEFFQLAEDIGAEPLPIVNCGMACQFQTGELVPLDQLQPYIQDALDLIEFANGPATSGWGAKRAAMGHSEPFGMRMLGIGNEQWGPEYFPRYEAFAKVLKEKHPEIELVSGSGPFPSDEKFKYAWSKLRALGADIVDEHCYAMPDWFLRAATRYDDYDRNGPKVFMGEYAAQSVGIASPDNRNNLRCALAEAAFLTGIERNSDVVVMSSYAPLLANVDAWQWTPDLIWFNSLQAYATPSYYVQQLFSRNRGDLVLPVEIHDTRPTGPVAGRIGLGTFQTSAEFKDIRVTRGGKMLFSGDSLADLRRATTFGGQWSVADGGVVRQQAPSGAARVTFGDYSWHDYTLSLKACKLAGREGFLIIFRNGDGGSFIQWNLGGWDNTHHGIQANLATHSEDNTVVDQVPGSIETDRWYDVTVKLTGSHVRCYLGGKLIDELDIPPPDLPRLFATASLDKKAGKVILKVVNPTGLPTDVDLHLNGVSRVESSAQVIVLHGASEDENSLAAPKRIAPQTSTVRVAGREFRHTFPPYSLSVLRVPVGVHHQ